MKNNHKIIEIIILQDQHKHISVNKKKENKKQVLKKKNCTLIIKIHMNKKLQKNFKTMNKQVKNK